MKKITLNKGQTPQPGQVPGQPMPQGQVPPQNMQGMNGNMGGYQVPVPGQNGFVPNMAGGNAGMGQAPTAQQATPLQQPMAAQGEKEEAPKPSRHARKTPTGDATAMETRVKKLTRATTVALATAALGVTFGIYSAVTSNATVALTKDGMTNVVVAAQQIEPGHAITDADLKTIEVPQAYVSSGASSDVATFTGQVAMTRIDSGSQMTTSVLAAQKDGSSLAGNLAQGTKAVTISVDETQGFSGLLKVGDTVDVLSTSKSVNGGSSKRITANAKVIALGSGLADTDNSYTAVTVQVTPKEAATIRAAQAGSDVSLVLHPTTPTKE